VTAPVVSSLALQVPQSYPTASLAAQAQAQQGFRAEQGLLMLMLLRDILRIWGTLDTRDVRSSWPALRISLAALIRDRFGMSAQMAASYYGAARRAAGITGSFPVSSVPLPSQALISATLDSTGPYSLLKRIQQGQTVPKALQNTGVVMSGAASRLILNGARQVILSSVTHDAEAVAWMRVTAANPCAWCAMLAGRGPVYRTERSAGFKAHGLCRCSAQAVFSAEDARLLRDANPLQQQWQQVTAGLSGKNAINAWRRWWNEQNPGAVGSHLAA
jgi:hypothetical protein